jgi:histidinol dehydrogenase
MRLIDLTSLQADDYASVMPRASLDPATAMAAVQSICAAVATEGEAALRRFSQQFDQVVPDSFRVDPHLARQAAAELDPGLLDAYALAIARRREVCLAEANLPDAQVEVADQAQITIRAVPVERVGLYVPGGLAPLASSVIMNVVPAQIAGVRSLAVATPPQAEFGGLPHPTILAVCHLLGVEEIYAVGGAQAIAMFAYGVAGLCQRVDMVTGPGNVYVAAAKRYLKTLVGIDSEAGPSEVAVIADQSADPVFVAADLISQAEHDPQAASVLISDSDQLIESVKQALPGLISQQPHRLRIQQALAGPQSAILKVRDIDQAVDVANTYAAEHLEIQTHQPDQVAMRINNAGAIFIGDYSPVSLGDYAAGSTHVLPTGGSARFASGLTVRSFIKTVHLIDYRAPALASVASAIELFAQSENLPAHAQAIAVRRRAHAQMADQSIVGPA